MAKHPECWAKFLDDCSGKVTREHLVSKSLYKNDKNVTIWGLDWTGNNAREISLASATAKVLCKRHNEGLSDLDEEISKIQNSIKEFYDLASEKFISTAPIKKTIKVDGRKLERWIIKTALNGIVASPLQFGSFTPDWYLVDLVFKKREFDYSTGMGLYLVPPEQYKNQLPHAFFSFRPLIATIGGQQCLLGILATLFRLPVFLKILPKTENLSFLLDGHDLIDQKFYHPREIGTLIDGRYNDDLKLFFQFSSDPQQHR